MRAGVSTYSVTEFSLYSPIPTYQSYCPICIYLEEVLVDLVTIERTQGVAVRRNIDFKFNPGEAWR